MKKLILLLSMFILSANIYAEGIEDVTIVFCESGPVTIGEDCDWDIIFYDSKGNVIEVDYSYDSATNTISINKYDENSDSISFISISSASGKSKKSRTVQVRVGG